MNLRVGLYFIFAAAVAGINLGVQRLCTEFLVANGFVSLFTQNAELSGQLVFWMALVAGTGVGAVIKYVLDKLFVFEYRTGSLKKDIVAFMLYLLMAVVTTAIFWGIQYLFHFGLGLDKYLGGAIGLAAGYTAKFFLDRKYVFVEREI